MYRVSILAGGFLLTSWACGCATQKESFTARTGTEQLLISSAVDKALDNFDYSALRDKPVFFETKYLDCVDKNYITEALRYRMMMVGARLLDKADKADIIVEVASGGVGTDGQFLFIGFPEIPLPGMIAPVAIPKIAFVERSKMNGTAKILLVAYDARTKLPIMPTGLALARSDLKNWNVLGMGNVQTGSVPAEIAATTKEKDFSVTTGINYATGAYEAPSPRHYTVGDSSPPVNGIIVSPGPSNIQTGFSQPTPPSGFDNGVVPVGYSVVQPNYPAAPPPSGYNLMK